MRLYSYSELKNQFDILGYQFPSFHVVGIRSNANKPNEFDDLIGLVNNSNLSWFTGTTDPGTHWLKNLMNPKGTALLKPGQYIDSWKLGLHRNQYKALVQCKPITVFRDKDRDAIAEETAVTDTGIFGINIHRANPNFISKFVDKWSAGCQVINNPTNFKTLIDACEASGLNRFTYTLLKEF